MQNPKIKKSLSHFKLYSKTQNLGYKKLVLQTSNGNFIIHPFPSILAPRGKTWFRDWFFLILWLTESCQRMILWHIHCKLEIVKPEEMSLLSYGVGHAVAQALSRWFPTAAARVRAKLRSCRICAQSSARAGFLWVPRFPLPINLSTATHSSSSNIRGWYNRPNSSLCTNWTQSH
jgi:hypothetical protein